MQTIFAETKETLLVCEINKIDFVLGSESVWSKVLAMEDKIRVNYNAVEELFCQKQVQSADKPAEKKKQPTEVIENVTFHTVLLMN